jgi:uncharacterized protein (DUF1330 family)
MANPSFLFVELAGEHADQVGILARAAADLRRQGAEVIAHAPAGRVSCLEPGTVGSGILLARWSEPGPAVSAAARSLVGALRQSVPADSVPLVLEVNGLPANGLPEMMEIPTVASVPVAPKSPRNALMVIRGSVSDPARIDGYRDVILPMLKERGGYYEVFALQPGEVTALSGAWTEQIFAVSRWPQRANAEDFWYSERYQTVAIPKRLGAGRFTVNLVDAAD